MLQTSNPKQTTRNLIEAYSNYTNCLYHTQQKQTYQIGNRNNFIYQLACICNRNGISQEFILQFCKEDFDLETQEMEQAIQSAYKNNIEEFGKYPQLISQPKTDRDVKTTASLTPEVSETEIFNDLLLSATYLPEIIFENLPFPFKEGCDAFPDRRERDVFLTGALGVISGCLPKVSGYYDRRICFPNLFTFVTAPAASGKGALVFSKELGNHYHKHLIETSKQELEKYKEEEERYKMHLLDYKKDKRSDMPKAPIEPPFKILFIPANSSSAMVIRHLQEGGGKGIMCETEADTMGNVLKQDWGGYSDLLHKTFHFEKISYSRKAEKEFVEIEQPRLSVALSGTPGQVLKLIPSSEDGLFSRFLFYAYNMEIKWRDVSPKGVCLNLNEYFQTLSQKVLQMTQFLEQHPTTVYLRDNQWQLLNQSFENILSQTINFVGSDAKASIYRLASILYRLATTLTACRKFQNQDTTQHIKCSDEDFITALRLVEAYLDHSLMLFDLLPKQEKISLQGIDHKKKIYYQALPSNFKTREAVLIAQEQAIKERTAKKYLSQFIQKGLLIRTDFGAYQKKSGRL